jgi:hypothetical protein
MFPEQNMSLLVKYSSLIHKDGKAEYFNSLSREYKIVFLGAMLCYGDNYSLIEPVVRAYQSADGGINDLVISATADPNFENLIEDFMSVYMVSLSRGFIKKNIYDYIFQESVFYSYGKSRVYSAIELIQNSDYLNSRQLLLDLLELSKTLNIEDYPLD